MSKMFPVLALDQLLSIISVQANMYALLRVVGLKLNDPFSRVGLLARVQIEL